MQRKSYPSVLKTSCLPIISILTLLCCTSTTFAADITISENTTWTPGTYTYDNVTITNTATLTLTSNSTTGEGVTLQAINLSVEPGAMISGNGKGYPRDQGSGTGGYGNLGSGGAGHGGAGGDGRNAAGGIGYGSITAPDELGSGGRSSQYIALAGDGGGLIKLEVSGNLTVDGAILSHGLQGNCWGSNFFCGGGGSGGSIHIVAGTLTGSGLIAANGGNGGGTRGGGGAGGRIALYYTNNTFTGVVNAHGGWGYQNGAAGTIFMKAAAEVSGDLLIDNDNGLGAVTTLLDGTYTFDTMTIRNKAKVDLSPSAIITAHNLVIENEGIFFFNAGTLNVSNLNLSSSSEIITDGDLSIDNVAFNSGTIVNNGNLTLTALTPADGLNNIVNNGRLNVPALTIEGFTLYQRGALNIADNTVTIGLSGVLASDVYLPIGNLIVKPGGILTHSMNGSIQQYAIDISAINLTVEPGGRIDVNGKGYSGQFWDNYTGPGGSSNTDIWNHPAGGAGHGGEGGDPRTLSFPGGGSYGGVLKPVDLGSGGGKANSSGGYYTTAKGGDGGGLIKLTVSNMLTANGEISANGGDGGVVDRYGSGGGSGGSVYIMANTVAGSGNITANGGSGGDAAPYSFFLDIDGGGGSGGRIALYYATNALTGNVSAYGGWGYQYGAAGTIFSKSNDQVHGSLTVDNNNNSGSTTPLAAATCDFDAIAVRNKARVDLSAGSVMTVNNFVAENGVFFNNPGTINASNFSVSSTSRITNNGDLSAGNITLDSGTITNNGNLTWNTSIFRPGTNAITNNGQLNVPHLTITDSTLIQRGRLNIADNAIAIGQNGVLASDVYLSIGNLIINSGGVLTHSDDLNIRPYTIDLSVANLMVNTGGRIDVNEKGFSGQKFDEYTGPGGASNNIFNNHPGGGAGYGGNGGASSALSLLGGVRYGDQFKPLDLGSGGGNANGAMGYYTTAKGGDGGGAIKLAISNTLTVNGEISANGGDGGVVDRYGSGGGSGGSVYIIANTITGSGNIAANGGSGGDAAAYSYFLDIDGGGGAGGRVAVYYAVSTFNGASEARGGTGGNRGKKGEDGTINISLMSPLETPFTFSGLDGKSFQETNIVETLLSREAVASNVLASGDLNGTFNFTDFEIVTIKTGPFAGKGFFKSQWIAAIEGASYEGTLEGMFFLNGLDKRIYLKGVASGGIRGITDGYLAESVAGSGIYDQYQSTWTLSRVGTNVVSAKIRLNGSINYQESTEYPSTQIYTSQSSFEGTSSGHYTGPLSTVLTHVRVADETNPYDGEGFSVISYVSDAGQGQAWTYDQFMTPGVVKLKGPLTSPLLGIIDATLDETKTPEKLFVTVERMDLGLPPAADLQVLIWGPRGVSPGQTINYIVEYRNDGVKAATKSIVYVYLDRLVSYVSATEGAYYDPYSHMVSWNLGALPAKTAGHMNIQTEVPWGLPQGHLLKNKAYISDIVLHSLTTNGFLNGIGYNSENNNLNELYQEFMSLTDSEWTRVYNRTNFITGALEAYLASRDIRTGRNAVGTDDLTIAGPIAIGDRPHWIGYSGGATTLVNQAKQGRINGDVLYLISPQSVTQEDVQATKAYFNKVVVYQGDDLIQDNFSFQLWTASGFDGEFSREEIMSLAQKTDPPDNQIENLLIELERAENEQLDHLEIFVKEPGNRINLIWQDGTSTEFFTTYTIQSEPGIDVLTLDEISHTDWIHLLIMFEEKYDRLPASEDWETLNEMLKKYLENSSSESVQAIVIAHDPNIKYGPEGNVLPWQKLDYKVEFENEGEGIAFGVYFTDTLDEDLDDSALEIGPVVSVQTGAQIAPSGTYDPQTRTVTWFVGEVGSKKGGYAKVSAHVRAGVPDKTEIINFAAVYFPSVPEVTMTNGVVSTVVSDMFPPVTASAVSPTPNVNGWNNTDAALALTAQDEINGSGVKEIHYVVNGEGEQFVAGNVATIPLSQEGRNMLNYWAIDNAGNNERHKTLEVKIDETDPTISVLNAPAPNSFGWNNTDVTVTFACADSVSGIAACTAPVILTLESQNQVVSGTALDLAGNSSSVGTIINLDKTPPMLTMPVLNPTYAYNSSASFNFSALDPLSGLASFSATFNGMPIANGTTMTLTKLGTNTFTLQAADEAGNTISQSAAFEVQYVFSGFLPPVVADGSQVYKLGRTLPVKFQLQDADKVYVSTATARLTLQQFSDDLPIGDPVVVESMSGADTGNMFRYDSDNQQYIFNLNTNSLSAGAWQLLVRLDDGTTETGFIKFK